MMADRRKNIEAAKKALVLAHRQPGAVVRVTVSSAREIEDVVGFIGLVDEHVAGGVDHAKTRERNSDLTKNPGWEFLNGSAIEFVLK